MEYLDILNTGTYIYYELKLKSKSKRRILYWII